MKPDTFRITLKKCLAVFLVVFAVLLFCNTQSMAAEITGTTEDAETTETDDVTEPLNLTLTMGDEEGSLSGTLQMLLVLTVISLAPSILVMMTSFTRIIVVLHFVRTALGLTSTPPNNVLIGLSLFLTFFIMSPVFSRVNTEALEPLAAGEITQEEAIEAAMDPMREFMINQTREQDIQLFLDIADIDSVSDWDDIPTTVIIPAFIISELRAAFIIGFMIYIPFIIIDMVVASTLMSMGMMMLPPTTISMPFKVLLFIMADGWNLIIGQLVQSFIL
ncbi:MAG: flagellar type III secretion system pore protein FliP [Lachnospiraceae bacterium]|nr:flagellar type III secretion system pore protein FliP [Lachnospiraceae bacterium]MBP3507214.1 flagellar type III secretion system pore protein FliP [Lachnospiraceae bacterium]